MNDRKGSTLFLKPLPDFPYTLSARFAREQDSMPEWQVELFHELVWLAKKCYEVERIAVDLRSENIKLNNEIKFMHSVLDEEINNE